MTVLILSVIAAGYLGMALGRWRGLMLDRTGIAMIGAILLYAGGAISAARAGETVDFATLGILFGLMVLSGSSPPLALVGSLANIIVAERAREQGVDLGFAAHARSGIPITLISVALAAAWLCATGAMRFWSLGSRSSPAARSSGASAR